MRTSGWRDLTRALAIAAVAQAGVACKKSVPEAPPAARAPAAVVEVLKDGRWLFTYVEPSGAFATTDKPDAVPGQARRIVRVVDPARPANDGEGAGSLDVHVVDLHELLRSGKAEARPISREAFESAALAQLPAGESSLLAGGGAPRPPAAAPEPSPDGGRHAGDGAAPAVILYGTSWCGACRSARTWLAQRGIPFADKDVERDPAAARELAAKAARLGVPADRVPVLDVRGRLLVGFDRARVEALLGSPS